MTEQRDESWVDPDKEVVVDEGDTSEDTGTTYGYDGEVDSTPNDPDLEDEEVNGPA